MSTTNLDDAPSILLPVKCHEVHRQLLEAVSKLLKPIQILHQIQPGTNTARIWAFRGN